MSGPDVEGVLGRHMIGYESRAYPSYVCLCGWDGAQGDNGSESDGQHDNADAARAHVAAAVLAEVRAWLESEAENVARVIAAIDGDPWDSLGDRGQDANRRAARAALAALAEQVAQVASVGEGEG